MEKKGKGKVSLSLSLSVSLSLSLSAGSRSSQSVPTYHKYLQLLLPHFYVLASKSYLIPIEFEIRRRELKTKDRRTDGRTDECISSKRTVTQTFFHFNFWA